MTIAVVDYGMGNLQSVKNAFESLGCEVVLAKEPAALADAARIVLPGVGAFGEAMENLRSKGWVDALDREVQGGEKPFLGLCLGMQLLGTEGTEGARRSGLGWVPGAVRKLNATADCRVPHVGWNDVRLQPQTRMYSDLGACETFYFLHSYVLVPTGDEGITGWCTYDTPFAASLERGHIWATQYHPEKSQRAGLTVLRNFVNRT